MISLNGNKKINTLLILAICTVSAGSKTPTFSILPKNHTARIVAFALAIGIPSFISLYTKGTPKELKFKTKLDDTWYNCLSDWIKILKIWNIIFSPSEYKKLIGKRWVGTRLSVISEETKTISEDGRKEVALTDKKLKCLPTGICGNFDAYVLKQCTNLYDTVGDIEKAFIVYYLLHGKDIEKLSDLWMKKRLN